MKLIKINKTQVNEIKEIPGLIACRIEYEVKTAKGRLDYTGPKFAPEMRLSQKFFYVMGGAKAKVNPVGRTRLRTAAKANSFCHHRAS